MGSSGPGRFTDYSGSKGSSKEEGGSSGVDRCKQAFSCTLEEVAQCDYFTQNQSLPANGTNLRIILEDRLFATDANGIIVGALPTSYNYLAKCIADNISYLGVITHTKNTPVPSITADFTPE